MKIYVVLSWDFEYTNDYGKEMTTRTSQELLEEVTYPVAMHEIIDNRVKKNEPLINNLFVPQSKQRVFQKPSVIAKNEQSDNTGEILSLNSGFGFIKHPNYPQNLFFHYQSTSGVDFNDLKNGDRVVFEIGKNDKGDEVAVNIRLNE